MHSCFDILTQKERLNIKRAVSVIQDNHQTHNMNQGKKISHVNNAMVSTQHSAAVSITSSLPAPFCCHSKDD